MCWAGGVLCHQQSKKQLNGPEMKLKHFTSRSLVQVCVTKVQKPLAISCSCPLTVQSSAIPPRGWRLSRVNVSLQVTHCVKWKCHYSDLHRRRWMPKPPWWDLSLSLRHDPHWKGHLWWGTKRSFSPYSNCILLLCPLRVCLQKASLPVIWQWWPCPSPALHSPCTCTILSQPTPQYSLPSPQLLLKASPPISDIRPLLLLLQHWKPCGIDAVWWTWF